MQGKRILLIVGGGIAAYKSLELVRLIQKAGGTVTPVLSRAGGEFVTPLSLSALSGQKVYTDLFDLTDEAEMGHIQLTGIFRKPTTTIRSSQFKVKMWASA